MAGMRRTPRLGRATIVVAALSSTLVAAGCGGGTRYANRPRPAVPVNLSASISDRGVAVSPRRVGAGPVTVIVTNQSATAQELTIETDQPATSGATGLTRTTGSIDPRGTASLELDAPTGQLLVHVKNSAIRPARVVVGEPRPNSGDQLLLP